jgi:hypothetical protein
MSAIVSARAYRWSTQNLAMHQMTEHIWVPWQVVTDGRTRAGQGFRNHMKDLLDAGYPLDFQTPEGTKSFLTAGEFESWFDNL